MRSLSFFPLVLLALLLTAPRASYAGSRPLEFQSLYEYLGVITTGDLLQSHTTAAGDYVFRDQESWCAFWSAAIVLPGPSSCPQIDFRHDTVIASIAGPQPSSCFGIEIDAIERHPGRAVEVSVLHTERIPNGSCGCLAVVINPVEIVVVSAPIGAVEFVHEDVQTTGCGCGFGLVNGDVHRNVDSRSSPEEGWSRARPRSSCRADSPEGRNPPFGNTATALNPMPLRM